MLKLKVNIKWIDTEKLEEANNLTKYFEGIDGIIIPGGFGDRGIYGMLDVIKYARENKRCHFIYIVHKGFTSYFIK